LERRDVLKLGVASLAVFALPSAVLAVCDKPHELVDLKDLMSGTREWLGKSDWQYGKLPHDELVNLTLDEFVFSVSRCRRHPRTCSYLTQVRKTSPERPQRQISSYIAHWRNGTPSQEIKQALSEQLKRSYIWLASEQKVV
jgi:hypothetical protein